MYTKIKDTAFDPVDHFNKILKKSNIRTQSIGLPLEAGFTSKKKHAFKHFIAKTYIYAKYADFLPLSNLHAEYMNNLIKFMSPDSFLPILYTAELTGAFIKIRNAVSKKTCKFKCLCNDKKCETDKRVSDGIVMEERENVLIVIRPDNSKKMYVKNLNTFVLCVKGIDYTLFGCRLKKNRYIKK